MHWPLLRDYRKLNAGLPSCTFWFVLCFVCVNEDCGVIHRNAVGFCCKIPQSQINFVSYSLVFASVCSVYLFLSIFGNFLFVFDWLSQVTFLRVIGFNKALWKCYRFKRDHALLLLCNDIAYFLVARLVTVRNP